MFIEYTIGGLAVFLTILAYMQKNVISYLKVNIWASSCFGLTLLFNGGITGGVIALLIALLYLVAVFTSKETRKKMSYIVPPIAFIAAFYSYDTKLNELNIPLTDLIISTNYLPAIGTLLVIFASLQANILINKTFLIIGLIAWAIYSAHLNAWFALTADLVGIFTLIISITRIRIEINKQLPHK